MTSKFQIAGAHRLCGYHQVPAPSRDLHRHCGLNTVDRHNHSFSRCAGLPKKTAK
jgi:hypothetical protein